MSAANPRDLAERWLRYAREDLEAAQASLAIPEIPPRHICWLAQQAAEKSLKAILILLQIEFPRRHDLDALRNLIPRDWTTTARHPDLADLTEWAVEARYPGDWAEPTMEDAKAALAQARAVYETVVGDFERRGVASAR